jgi:hypothetical protein
LTIIDTATSDSLALLGSHNTIGSGNPACNRKFPAPRIFNDPKNYEQA